MAFNSVIVRDNDALHRKKQLISLAESNNIKIALLPPYSPEYNPIEKFWAWLNVSSGKSYLIWIVLVIVCVTVSIAFNYSEYCLV
ncbi:MAG: transposase [Clostridiales bacterium]|jgi:transposase|nr:transposase [Clostridiales bacterium]